ncbi:uncharacterized protein [Centruroides vittatus]|uniref:uncharacterized protein n=1 Tax=Centruroides vittatus TaxID=120091 RepID=UPI00350F20DC
MKYLAVLAFVALFYVCNCEECFSSTTQDCIKGKLEKLTEEEKQKIEAKAEKCCNDKKDDKRLVCIIKQFQDNKIWECVEDETKKCLMNKFKENKSIKDIVNIYITTDDCTKVFEEVKKKVDEICSDYSGDDKDVTFMCECKDMFYQ